MEEITQEDVIQIIKMLEESTFNELHLEMGDLKLVVKKGDEKAGLGQEAKVRVKKQVPSKAAEKAAVLATEVEPPEEPSGVEEEGFITIKAPMLGTFYRAPKPGAPPFVEEGQLVTEEDTVCVIEVMKLFNTVKAGVRGRIAKVCAENSQMVEYRQTLFLVEADEEGQGS
ncbi:MAG: acetyl-CoA carboxylase biotin carboxyl carrier protein [Desulfobacteraceae bacterium]|nr:acetyl-CoA carboxylase biotin carboxyl carrier protein [Desulfobacteraceae bacterium]